MTAMAHGVNDSHGSAAAARPPTLRPYQAEAIAAVWRELARVRSTLLVAATGTGKTVTFAELARNQVSRSGRVLIVVHRDELIRQARRKCEAIGLWPDVEKGKERASTLAKVVLASVQSLRGARLTRWARDHFALVIIDEAHHAAATGYRAIVDYFDGAKVVGVTATAARADGKPLGEVFQSVAFTYDIRQAIRDGYLVPIVARRVVVESVDLRTVGMRAGDFAQDELADVLADERALRGVVVPLLEQARDRLTIAFCVNVAHAQALAGVLNQYRPGCARAVSGQTDDEEREHLLAAHAAGEFQFLVNCDLLVEGYDAPPVACVAMVRPTKSWARYVQCAGRGLRPSPETGKRDCLILDFTGQAGKNALVGPADCLSGAGQIPDDVRAEIERLLATAQLEIAAVVDQAEGEVAKRRASLRIDAVVRYHAEHIDPFVGAEPGDAAGRYASPTWKHEAASQAQLDALAAEGVVLSKLPALTRAEAWDLLSRIKSRRRKGLCSYKMARRLASLGWPDTRTLTHERALELRDKCLRLGWHPRTLADEPEVIAARTGTEAA